MGREKLEIDSRQNVVIGLGPTGLAVAIEFCRSDSKNRKVVAFERRSEYTRREVLRLDGPAVKYLMSLVGQGAFQQYVNDDKIVYDIASGQQFILIQTKNLERLLRAELEKYVKAGKIEILDASDHSAERIQNIDKKQHLITTHGGREISFAIISEADGGTRSFANELLDENIVINYLPLQQEQFCPTHAVANFKIPMAYSEFLGRNYILSFEFRSEMIDIVAGINSLPPSIFQTVMSNLQKLGWEHDSLPEFRTFVNGDNLYIGGECPSSMQNDPQQIELWVRALLPLRLGQQSIDRLTLHVDAHHRPECRSFNIVLDEACQPVVTFPKLFCSREGVAKSAHMVLMGEALRKSHYHTASGAYTGLLEAELFRHFLQSRQTKADWKKYVAGVEAIRDEMRQRVDQYLQARKRREGEEEPQFKKSHSVDSMTSIDKAYERLAIPRFSLYLGSIEANIQKLEEFYERKRREVGDLDQSYRIDTARAIILADLQQRLLQSNAKFMLEFTCSREYVVANQCARFAYRERSDNGDHSYHFCQMDVNQDDQVYVREKMQYCKFVITSGGACKLVMPTFVSNICEIASARFGLNIVSESQMPVSLSVNTVRQDMDLLVGFHREPIISDLLGNADVEYDLSDDKINEVLSAIYYQFHADINASVEVFVARMRDKIARARNARMVHVDDLQEAQEGPGAKVIFRSRLDDVIEREMAGSGILGAAIADNRYSFFNQFKSSELRAVNNNVESPQLDEDRLQDMQRMLMQSYLNKRNK